MEESNDALVNEFLESKNKELNVDVKPTPVAKAESDFLENVNGISDIKRYNTKFSEAMENANENVAKELTADKEGKVYKKMEESISGAIQQSADNEKKRAEHDAHLLDLQKTIVENEHEIERLKLQKTDYDKKRERRQYVYEGLAPILEMVGITKPSSLFLMWLLTACLFVPYLFWKLFRGIFITPLTGMNPEERKSLAKGYLWTLLVLIATAVVAFVVLKLLGYYGVI